MSLLHVINIDRKTDRRIFTMGGFAPIKINLRQNATAVLYPNNPLWDGEQCPGQESSCCTNPNTPTLLAGCFFQSGVHTTCRKNSPHGTYIISVSDKL